MALSAKIRYLVLNRTNQVIAPQDEDIEGMDKRTLKAAGEIPKQFSPSFQNKATAQKFACALAAKYEGERFYVAQVLGGAVVETASWTDATAGVLHDEATASDLDDGEVNE